MLLLAGAFALTACTDDNESNPMVVPLVAVLLSVFVVVRH